MTDFETKDSGERAQFDSGMQRDTEAGKARFDLIIPNDVPYEDQLLTRFAKLLGRGAEKYTERNWEQANSEAEIARAKSSAFRHFMQWFCGEVDEDHAAATLFNIMVVETTRTKLERAESEGEEFFEKLLGPDHFVTLPEAAPTTVYNLHVEGATPDEVAEALSAALNRRDSYQPPTEDLRM